MGVKHGCLAVTNSNVGKHSPADGYHFNMDAVAGATANRNDTEYAVLDTGLTKGFSRNVAWYRLEELI